MTCMREAILTATFANCSDVNSLTPNGKTRAGHGYILGIATVDRRKFRIDRMTKSGGTSPQYGDQFTLRAPY